MRLYSIEPVFGLSTLLVTIPGRTCGVATLHPQDDGSWELFPVEPALLPDASGMPLSFADMGEVEAFLGMIADEQVAA